MIQNKGELIPVRRHASPRNLAQRWMRMELKKKKQENVLSISLADDANPHAKYLLALKCLDFFLWFYIHGNDLKRNNID